MATDPRTLATTYFRAWQEQDFGTLRSLLADDVTSRGTLGTANGWTRRLVASGKERLLISGLGVDRVAALAAAS